MLWLARTLAFVNLDQKPQPNKAHRFSTQTIPLEAVHESVQFKAVFSKGGRGRPHGYRKEKLVIRTHK